MKPPSPLSSIFAGVCIATLAIPVVASRLARAEAPVLLWGFQRNCAPTPQVDRQVEKDLYTQRRDVGLLQSPKGKPLPLCVGERCAQALRAVCPSSTGRLLGGQVVASRYVVRTRLWLYDQGTGQTAYQDDYCQACDLGIAEALSVQARHLIDHPAFGAPPGPTPTYCSAVAASPSPRESSGGPMFLTVYGEGKHKAALQESLKQQLGRHGRAVFPVTVEPKNDSREDLEKIVAGHKDAQVLGVQVPKDGKVQMFLFDQSSGKSDFKMLDCPDCLQDKDTLVIRVQSEVLPMLDHCFGWRCGDPSVRPAGAAVPAEACEPFPEAGCPGADLLTSGSSPVVTTSLDAKTARIIKGLTWGAFAVSTATAISLGIANQLVIQEINGQNDRYTLARPAWAMAGASAAFLGIALPITIVVNRAQRPVSNTPYATAPAASIQCPN